MIVCRLCIYSHINEKRLEMVTVRFKICFFHNITDNSCLSVCLVGLSVCLVVFILKIYERRTINKRVIEMNETQTKSNQRQSDNTDIISPVTNDVIVEEEKRWWRRQNAEVIRPPFTILLCLSYGSVSYRVSVCTNWLISKVI